MNNPGTILKLWNKAVQTHEANKDAKTLPKKGQEQKLKVKQGLTALKSQAATDLTAQANRKKFIDLRDNLGKRMTRYCRYLKTAKDEDKAVLPKYLKTVKRLTAIVLKLDPGDISLAEEDGSLDSLEGVDLADLERALEAPDTGEDLDEPPSPEEEPPTAAKPASGPDQMALFTGRLKALMPKIQKAVTDGVRAGTDASQRVKEAGEFGRKKDFAQANQLLDDAERLLANGTAAAAPSEADTFEEMYTGLLESLNEDLPRLRREHPATAATVEQILAAAAGHAAKGDYKRAYTFLDRASTAVATSAGAARAEEAAREIPEGKVAQVKAAFELARMRWDAAVTVARNRMKPVDAELQAEYPKAVAGLKAILDSYWNELLEALRAGQAMEDRGELGKAVGIALTKVKNLRAEVSADPLFAFLDQHGMQVTPGFAKAFDEVEKLLRI
jgi:hypothetical protein